MRIFCKLLLSTSVTGNAVITLWMATFHGSVRKMGKDWGQFFLLLLGFFLLDCFPVGSYWNQLKSFSIFVNHIIKCTFSFYSMPVPPFFHCEPNSWPESGTNLMSTWPQIAESCFPAPLSNILSNHWSHVVAQWLQQKEYQCQTQHPHAPCGLYFSSISRLCGSMQGMVSLGCLVQMQMSVFTSRVSAPEVLWWGPWIYSFDKQPHDSITERSLVPALSLNFSSVGDPGCCTDVLSLFIFSSVLCS